jgi:hypothetical protein
MRIPAASCTTVHELVSGPPQPVRWLGSCASALYLVTNSGDVLAVLSQDAVRLPCSLVVAHRADEVALSTLLPDTAKAPLASVGDGALRWPGPHTDVAIVATRRWRPPTLQTGRPQGDALDALEAALREHDLGIDVRGELTVDTLLGRGPGLTPSGDDLLAGYLVGSLAFGCPARDLAAEISRCAGTRTTALSAQLLRHAAAGECVPQLARLVDACLGVGNVNQAIEAVLAIGHTSGAALATGLLAAA